MSSSSPAASRAASPETERVRRKYKGVRLRKWGKWVSEIRLPNSRERIWLGSYDAPEKAARAFDAAFVCLRGYQGAADGLNFPDSPPPPCRRSLDPQEVQAAALSHANRAPTVTAVYDCSAATATGPSMDPWFSTQQYGHSMDIFGGGGGGGEVVLAQDEGMDWRAGVARQSPLFSPTTGWGGSADHFFEAPLPEDDDMQTDERDHAASASLWSFDPRDSYFRY